MKDGTKIFVQHDMNYCIVTGSLFDFSEIAKFYVPHAKMHVHMIQRADCKNQDYGR